MASDAGELAGEYARRHAAARAVGAPLAAQLDYLRFCRLNHVGQPADVWPVAHGALTRGGERGLGADYYSVLEQAVVAGYAVGGDVAPVAADGYLASLEVAWPDSARVGRLAGLRLESLRDTDGAVAVYDGILAKHPSHAPSWKRKVAALAGAGRDADALKALNAYLEAFPGDVEAVSLGAGCGVEERV
jgi:tetratricopeptide (TPR) repeat protein